MALVFCVNSLPRAGTMLVRGTLLSHPDIICYAEIFGAGAHGAPQFIRHKPPPAVFAKLAGIQGVKAAGFCIHRSRLQYAYVSNPHSVIPAKMPTIFVYRENILRQMVSHRLAKRTRVWTVRDPDQKICKPLVTIGVNAFEKYVKATERKNRLWKKFKRVLRVSYEEILEDPQAKFAEMQQFLGVPVQELAPTTIKVGGAIRPVLQTYGKLKRHCRGTRWEKFFDE